MYREKKNGLNIGLLFCWTGSQKKERRISERLTARVECMCVLDGEGSSTALELKNSMDRHVSDQFPCTTFATLSIIMSRWFENLQVSIEPSKDWNSSVCSASDFLIDRFRLIVEVKAFCSSVADPMLSR